MFKGGLDYAYNYGGRYSLVITFIALLQAVCGILKLGQSVRRILHLLLGAFTHFGANLLWFFRSNQWFLLRCLHFPHNDR